MGVSRFRREAVRFSLECMPRFLVESYVAVSPGAFGGACEHARRIAEKTPDLRYVDTTYLPGDEIVMHLFDAPSVEALEEAARRTGLQFERIVQAVNDSAGRRKESPR